jgi:1-acyl-sn-glycerol-3-phosphate acyltransferase
MRSKISRWILKLWGWKLFGKYPHHLDKFVLIAMPHTSWWDIPLGFLLRSAHKGDVKYLAKDSLFKPPHGWFFYIMGGYPVDRSKRNNFVDAVVDIFNSKEKFSITIAPEGTRKPVKRLKTGFYYIAKGANIPIVMVKFDFGKMEVGFSEPFYPSWDKEKDFEFIYDFYKGARGKVPEYGFLYDQ